MRTLKYATGRQYNGKQVLEIIIADKKVENDFVDYVVLFRDSSRNIAGQATVFMGIFDTNFSENEIGRAVLSSYDAGHYDLISSDTFQTYFDLLCLTLSA